MQSGKKYNVQVLCTRPVSEMLVEDAVAKGIELDLLSFITTAPIETVEVQQEVEHALLLSATIVFTSMNAVEAVAAFMIDTIPNWRIYCIGNTTRQLVTKYFGEASIAGTANSAEALASLIIEEGEAEELIFFCGDQRRDELPGLLNEQEIFVDEVVVYQTVAVPHKLEKQYHGVLFFSPSAVHSFFTVNKLDEHAIVFAIGTTTADAVAAYCSNKIVMAPHPGKEELVREMIGFFA